MARKVKDHPLILVLPLAFVISFWTVRAVFRVFVSDQTGIGALATAPLPDPQHQQRATAYLEEADPPVTAMITNDNDATSDGSSAGRSGLAGSPSESVEGATTTVTPPRGSTIKRSETQKRAHYADRAAGSFRHELHDSPGSRGDDPQRKWRQER